MSVLYVEQVALWHLSGLASFNENNISQPNLTKTIFHSHKVVALGCLCVEQEKQLIF